MAAIPYVKVFVKKNGRDLTDYVTSFYHEAHIKKDNISEIKFSAVKGEFDGDDADITAGEILVVTYGFAATIVSVSREVRISNIEWSYPNGQEIIRILCTDKANVIKKGGTARKWSNKTASQIVAEIADIYSLNTEISSTKQVYSSYLQGKKSDYEVIHDLARREGAYESFVNDNTLYFRPTDYNKNTKRVFTLGVDIISLDINLREQHQSRGTNKSSSELTGIDPKTKKSKVVPQSGGEWRQKFEGGTYVNRFNTDESLKSDIGSFTKDNRFVSNGNQSVESVSNEGETVESKIQRAMMNGEAEAMSVANGYAVSDQNKKKKKVLTARLQIELEPNFAVGDIIAINGIAKRLSGNWYIESVKDSITSRGITEIELTRDASIFKVKSESDPTEQRNSVPKKTTGNSSGNGSTDQIRQSFIGDKYLGKTTDWLEANKNNLEKVIKENFQK